MPHALIVDDDADTLEMMAALVAGEGCTVVTAATVQDAHRQIALREPDVVLLDINLPDGSGMELAQEVATRSENTEIVLVTGYASLETSIQALRLGATDYLQKPINVKQLQGVLSRLKRPAALHAEISDLRAEYESSGRFGRLWGRSAPMQTVYNHITRVAATAVSVLLSGESGTGKELAAQMIHELSRRCRNAFVPVNCGAISPQLMESEMFGHEKGSFTGANRQHLGFFERAASGTLFLDEITEMPLDLQIKLLRVLESGTFMRVGGSDLLECDVRVIAATNRPPMRAVAEGRLREDLFYRLNVFGIHLPPLRERREDIGLLAEHFLAEINRSEHASKHFSPDATERLASHHWPGNVRELRNAVQRAFVMAEGEVIDSQSLPAEPAPASNGNAVEPAGIMGGSLAEVEKRLILTMLAQHNGHKARTAETLGISLKTLYNRLKEYGGDESGLAIRDPAKNARPRKTPREHDSKNRNQ